MQSHTDNDEPNRDIPSTEMLEATRLKPRNENVEPILCHSNIEIDEPSRATLRRDNDDPK